jgi:GNAT superfamily N-acetyltransferase
MTSFTFRPLTPDRFTDLEELFGPKGACAGCWCMYWRLTRAEWTSGQGEGNRRALRRIVRAGKETGILAYAGGRAVGWCAVTPRGELSSLERSRILKPVDDRPVWSITCFFVARAFRRRGLTVKLMRAAAAHARSRGARILEGYPVEPRTGSMPDVFAFTGLASAFRRAGFVEVARRSDTRPIMRLALGRARVPRPAGGS